VGNPKGGMHMTVINQDNLNLYLELKDAIESRVEDVLDKKTKLERVDGRTFNGYIESIEFEDGKVKVTTVISSNCRCCSDENDWYYFPIKYLFNDDWAEEVKEKTRLLKEKEEKAKEAKAAKAKADAEERERQEFERLQKKFGGN
jgi:hypothetical protein